MAASSRAIRRSPLERMEYAIIVSSLLLMVVVTVQPILNLFAISLSDPAGVAGISGLAVLPNGFSIDVWLLLLSCCIHSSEQQLAMLLRSQIHLHE